MIDPVEFGELKSDVKALYNENLDMKKVQNEMRSDIKDIHKVINEAKGGGKILLGAIAFASSIISIVIQWLFKKFGVM